MAGYGQVPRAAPEGGWYRASSDGDEAGGSNLAVQEQEKLIQGNDARPEARAAQETRHRPHRPRRWCFFSLVTLFCFLTTLILIKFSLFDAFVRTVPQEPQQPPAPEQTEPDAAEDFRRPSSEYVLGRDWDFHAPPTVREYNWVIKDIVANPDGVFRPMVVINGKFPGELIRCNEGDTIVVNVDNQAANATAIHWHGIFQNGSNFMDGTPGVTQCPIAPGKKFRYEFVVTGQAGTCKPCLPTQAISELG